jgi:energy-coupling factor transporter ATP-binding protein EcfA2/uncharacterized membrane protein
MESIAIENLSFRYPGQERPALDDVSICVRQGDFVTLCGFSGCGKTTLLRQLKPVMAPHGNRMGRILFGGADLFRMDFREQSRRIGFVQQSPDNQIVTDKVWHELAFGLESLGCGTPFIRLRVAEMASFFGMQTWFHKDVAQLSGGQKQLLNLASVMAMQPETLLLDEPTSQLDPVAASEFLQALGRINRELGVTVLMTEHRLEEALPLSDRVAVMDKGRILAYGTPGEVGSLLGTADHGMFLAMPTPMRVYAAVTAGRGAASGTAEATGTSGQAGGGPAPVTVREGRAWLEAYAARHGLRAGGRACAAFSEDGKLAVCAAAAPVRAGTARNGGAPAETSAGAPAETTPALEIRELCFRYGPDAPPVLNKASFQANSGELLAIMGDNGSGKSTLLSLLSGLEKPQSGEIRIFGKTITKMPAPEAHGVLVGALPQNPQLVFVKKTVRADLREILRDLLRGRKLPGPEAEKRMDKVVRLCLLQDLLDRHPYDLSGGEQQRAALAKILLLEPQILLLDEPTKGMDAGFKQTFAMILKRLKRQGRAIVMVSHDVEFCAGNADRCAMLFDGAFAADAPPPAFFSGNSFYTTAASRMARRLLPQAVTAEALIEACGGTPPPADAPPAGLETTDAPDTADASNTRTGSSPAPAAARTKPGDRKLPKRTVAAAVMILLLIPLTIFVGDVYLAERKYYFISALILLEAMLPFVLIFEGRKPKARELVVISVLFAIAALGRAAFFMLPEVKPVGALVIISAVAFGGETGFLVGAMTALASNFFFGQGPWTPWQMFAFGIIGFLAGILFRKGLLPRGRLALAVFGGISVFLVYGGIVNAASVFMYQANPTWPMFAAAYLTGFPFDLIHAVSTVFFLLVLAEPFLEKLDRIKHKYGLME